MAIPASQNHVAMVWRVDFFLSSGDYPEGRGLGASPARAQIPPAIP